MALTRLPGYTLLSTDSYTFGNANVSGNIVAGNIKTDHILYANGTAYQFSSNAAGSNTQVQFNDANSFAGSANLTFNKTSNTLTVTNITANGAGLTSLTGANVTGFVPNANVANTAFAVAGANVSGEVSFAATANSVAVANVSGIGNIATINKDGNASNILYGNGVFASAPVTYGNSNVGIYLPNYSGNLNPGNVNVTTDLVVGGNLTISGTTTTINSTAVSINDVNIVLANNASNALQANGAGITINGASANILYNSTSNTFTFSHPLSANGAPLTSITGANVTGFVPNANVANTAYSVAAANVTGLGNIATINKDGNASNILYGNGAFATAPLGGATVSATAPSTPSAGQLWVDSNTGELSIYVGGAWISAVTTVTTAETVTVNAQPNITSVGTLTSLTVTGNISSGNANLGNLVTANFFSGNGSSLTGVSVAAANVTGLGNLATINKDGNASNILYGNGVFASAPVTYGNSNVATFLASFGSNTITTTGNISAGNVTVTSNITTANANVTGTLTANVISTSGAGSGNISGANWIIANYFQGNASSLSSITGANVTGFVPNANVANTAYSVSAANVTGLGNIATINKDGNASNLLYGNGVFAAAPVSYGNSNVATFLASFGSNTITTTGNISVGNITATNLGNVSSLNKDGNASNILYGNGVFAAPVSASPSVTIDTFTGDGSNTAFTLSTAPANANMVTVNYNGAILTKDTYSIVGSTLTFVAAPANGYSLEITTLTGGGAGGGSGASRVQSTILGMVFGG